MVKVYLALLQSIKYHLVELRHQQALEALQFHQLLQGSSYELELLLNTQTVQRLHLIRLVKWVKLGKV